MPDRRETPVKSSGAPVEGERIAKYLASAGLASRREIERFILDGRVVVDGVKLESPAFKVTGPERILVDGKPVARPSVSRLWRYHKPAGLVTTNQDPDGRPTIFDMLPGELPRVLTIGRLDLNTEGLLLLTNDGGLARALELPSTGLERTYRARAYGRITQPDLDRLRDGVVVDGVEAVCDPCRVPFGFLHASSYRVCCACLPCVRFVSVYVFVLLVARAHFSVSILVSLSCEWFFDYSRACSRVLGLSVLLLCLSV